MRVLYGMDSEPAGSIATADIEPLDALGEYTARAEGRDTFRLYGHGKTSMQMEYRLTADVALQPIGARDTAGEVVVLRQHKCGG
jgi:hypothetical protein